MIGLALVSTLEDSFSGDRVIPKVSVLFFLGRDRRLVIGESAVGMLWVSWERLLLNDFGLMGLGNL